MMSFPYFVMTHVPGVACQRLDCTYVIDTKKNIPVCMEANLVVICHKEAPRFHT